MGQSLQQLTLISFASTISMLCRATALAEAPYLVSRKKKSSNSVVKVILAFTPRKQESRLLRVHKQCGILTHGYVDFFTNNLSLIFYSWYKQS